MANNLVKFYTGTAAAYASLATKDENTLYFITDARTIYKGTTPFGGGSYEVVTSFPATGDAGTIYINTDTGEVKYWNGAAYVQVVKPYATTLRETGATDDAVVTEKAVVDYIASRLADLDVGVLEGRVDDIEAALDNIYTKTETDAAITTAIGKADHLKREIVQILPDVADANEQTIYMVSIADGTANQKYEEFMLINGAFEKIGDSAVDLTNYPTTTEVDKKVADGLKDAKDYADGLASNYATAAQGALADSALQPADVVTGKTDGTISVDGTEVSVAGLKSAAYTDSTDYDAAGAADTALANAKKYVDDALTWKDLGGAVTNPPKIDTDNVSIELDASNHALVTLGFSDVTGSPYGVTEMNSNNENKVLLNNSVLNNSVVAVNQVDNATNVVFDLGSEVSGTTNFTLNAGFALNEQTVTENNLSLELDVPEKAKDTVVIEVSYDDTVSPKQTRVLANGKDISSTDEVAAAKQEISKLIKISKPYTIQSDSISGEITHNGNTYPIEKVEVYKAGISSNPPMLWFTCISSSLPGTTDRINLNIKNYNSSSPYLIIETTINDEMNYDPIQASFTATYVEP